MVKNNVLKGFLGRFSATTYGMLATFVNTQKIIQQQR
jgi:hypothetical protein